MTQDGLMPLKNVKSKDDAPAFFVPFESTLLSREVLYGK
jgi:hypothetical protein